MCVVGDVSDEDDLGRFINDDAFSAFGGLKKTKDLFVVNVVWERLVVSKVCGVGGFLKVGVEMVSLLMMCDVDVILKCFDET